MKLAILLSCEGLMIKNTMAISTGWGHCLDSHCFTSHHFCAISANVNRVKRADNILVFL